MMSIGMRNELRPPLDNPSLIITSYGWPDWYKNMVAAAEVIYAANPDVLIFFSGLLSDLDLSPIPTGLPLGNGLSFNASSFDFAHRIVLELHNYQTSIPSCSLLEGLLYMAGFDAMDTSNGSVVNVLPVVLTEFGFEQDATTYKGVYASCLRSYIPSLHAGWMTWVLAGSYYIREGIQDYDETWGKHCYYNQL
jgi:hypothetical protein